MNEDLMGKRIKQKRTELGLTMEMLGNILGVGKSAVNKWEKGKVKNIKRSTIAHMAVIFECSPVWLMGMDIESTSYDPEVPIKSGIDKITLKDTSLTEEEKSIIDKYRTDEKFRNIIQALNVYDATDPTPAPAPKVPKHKSYAYKYAPNTKKIAKPRKSKEDLA